jgi:hypothetical protein
VVVYRGHQGSVEERLDLQRRTHTAQAEVAHPELVYGQARIQA